MKVFLVENASVMRERLEATLAEIDGVECAAHAATPVEALAGIARTLPDVVVLDLNLDEGSGLEVLRQVKAALPLIKLVVLTNMSNAIYRRKCLQLGADHFFDKSREFGAFVELLMRLATGKA